MPCLHATSLWLSPSISGRLTPAGGQVSVDVPDVKGRTEILKVHARNKKLSDEVDLNEIAQRTPGFSGADLANLLNEVRDTAPAPAAAWLSPRVP